jgi:hypothetical protein
MSSDSTDWKDELADDLGVDASGIDLVDRVVERKIEEGELSSDNLLSRLSRRDLIAAGGALAGGSALLSGATGTAVADPQYGSATGRVGTDSTPVESVTAQNVTTEELGAESTQTAALFTDSRAPTVAIRDDGSTYYADGPDNSVASNSDAGALIDSALSAVAGRCGRSYLQSTTRPYRCATTITVDGDAQAIEGASSSWFFDGANRGVQLRDNGITAGNPILNIGKSEKVFNGRVERVGISGSNNSVKGVEIDAGQWHFRDLLVKECDDFSIHLTNGNGNYFIAPRLERGSVGWRTENGANDTQIMGGTTNRMSSWGAEFEGGAVEMVNHKFWNNGDGTQGSLLLTDTENNRIANCEFDSPDQETNVRINADSGAETEVIFSNSWFWANGTSPSTAHIEFTGSGTIDAGFVGCHFDGGTDAFADNMSGTLDATATGCYIGAQASAPTSVASAGNYGPGSF